MPLPSTSVAAWNKELNSPEAVYRILAGFSSTCILVTNKFWHAQQFKITHWAYILHLLSPQQPHKCFCPLCGQDKPSLLHRPWLCSHIASFWGQVEHFAVTVTGCSPTKDVFLLLFSDLTSVSPKESTAQQVISQQNKAWLSTWFMSARHAILKNWSSAIPPNISDVHQDLITLLRKKKLDADLSFTNTSSHLQLKWLPFITKILPRKDQLGYLSSSTSAPLNKGASLTAAPKLISHGPTDCPAGVLL